MIAFTWGDLIGLALYGACIGFVFWYGVRLMIGGGR